jgi:Ser/Thr protein kinase RdoA (MazF antagonist)
VQIVPLGSAGGMSGAQFWRISTTRRVLALRRWPTEHPTPEHLQFVHDVLEHAAQRRITFLPVPIRTSRGESFVQYGGYLWELAPWMPGTANYEHSPSSEKLQAALQALAQFHIAATDFPHEPSHISVGRQAESTTRNAGTARTASSSPSSPAIQRHQKRLQQLADGGLEQLSAAIAATIWPDLARLARQFLAALPHALPRALAQLDPLAHVALPLQPCLRDVWHDHVLFTGNEVTGIVDFGAVDFDTPATDIARLLGSLVGDASAGWQMGLTAYSTVRPLSADEMRAVTALDASGTLLAGGNWIRWIYIEGRQFENRAQIIERFRTILHRTRCVLAP